MMEPTIDQMNEVIALFEGRKNTRLNSPDVLGRVSFWSDPKRIDPFYTDELDYHSNWNSLMAVVDKLETLTTEDGRGEVNFIVTIEPGYCIISQGGEGEIIECQDNELEKKSIVHKAVYDFIQWHNQNKKP